MRAAAAVVAAVLALGGVASAKGALDGKSFAVETGEKGRPAGRQKETLTFKDGKFHSSACDAYGFGDGAYTANPSGGTTTWQADTSSAKEGRIHWRGTITADVVEGSFVWTKPGQPPTEYWFKTKR